MLLLVVFALCNVVLGAVLPGPIVPSATAATVATESPVSTSRSPSLTATASPSSASTVEPVEPTSTPPAVLERIEWFNERSRRAWSKSFYGDNIREWARPEGQEVSKRDDHPFHYWYAQGYDAESWGYSFAWIKMNCLNTSTHSHEAGIIMKSVVKQDNPQTEYLWWYNGTKKLTPRGSSPSTCTLNNGWATQCTDYLWNPTSAAWEFRGWNNNNNMYYTYYNASYGGKHVRTIFDCLLQKVAVEYSSWVDNLGLKPIQYQMDGMRYWRWYDFNNFAWFAACPPQWQTKRGRVKRQGIKGRNSNPIWDFGPLAQRYWNSDMTPYPTYLIENYDVKTSYTAMYWPEDDEQVIEVEGQICQLMGMSRPGLRHWTAKMVNIPPMTYPDINLEINYGYGWYGWDKFAGNYITPEFNWT